MCVRGKKVEETTDSENVFTCRQDIEKVMKQKPPMFSLAHFFFLVITRKPIIFLITSTHIIKGNKRQYNSLSKLDKLFLISSNKVKSFIEINKWNAIFFYIYEEYFGLHIVNLD